MLPISKPHKVLSQDNSTKDIFLNFMNEVHEINYNKNYNIERLKKDIDGTHLNISNSINNVEYLLKNSREELETVLKTIKSVKFSSSEISEKTIHELLKIMPNLAKLQIEDASIQSIDLSNFKSIEYLSIFFCTDLTSLDLSSLSNLRNLKIHLCFSLSSIIGISDLCHCRIDFTENDLLGSSNVMDMIHAELNATCQIGPLLENHDYVPSQKKNVPNFIDFFSLKNQQDASKDYSSTIF